MELNPAVLEFVNYALQARPDLTQEEAIKLAEAVLAQPASSKPLTACDFRQVAQTLIGGDYYVQANFVGSSGQSRPVTIQLWSGAILEGSLEQVLEDVKRDAWRIAPVREFARKWMNRSASFSIEPIETPFSFVAFAEDRLSSGKMLEFCQKVRQSGALLVLAPTVDVFCY